jgi:hypothetical protein
MSVRTLKILMVENIANVSFNLTKRLRERGFDAILLARNNPKAGKLDLTNVYNYDWIYKFDCENLYDKTFRYLFNVLKFKADIIHCHYALEQGFYGVASKWLRRSKKLIVHCHGTDVRERLRTLKYGWIVNFSLKNADEILVSTPDLLLKGYNMRYLPNPVDLEIFKPSEPKVNLHHGHKIAILHPSRIVWRHKGTDKCLYALKRLVEEGYDIFLTLVEYGPDLIKTKKLVYSLNLIDNVHFIQPLNPEEMANYYNSCDIVWAQFGVGHLGLVTLESLACNKPTLVDFRYPEHYAEQPPIFHANSINEIVEKTKSITELKVREVDGRSWVEKFHSYPTVLNTLINTYTSLVSN